MFSQKGSKDFKKREKKNEDKPKKVVPCGSTKKTKKKLCKLIGIVLYFEIWNGFG